METRMVKLHDDIVLWPEWKSVEDVLDLKATTPDSIWRSVYQGDPLADGGAVFNREWWNGRNRYDINDAVMIRQTVARWISFDTGMKDKKTSAYSAAVVADLTHDYRLLIRQVVREKLQFPDLANFVTNLTYKWSLDRKLRGVIVEDKMSGISVIQTVRKTAPTWLSELILEFPPQGDKEFRAGMASVWAKNNCILFPNPDKEVDWLFDFENEVFNFPSTTFMDQVDAFSQLVLWTENLLEEGWRARGGIRHIE